MNEPAEEKVQPLCWTSPDGTAHESCSLLVFVEGRLLGRSSIDPGDCPELGYPRGGVAYFCRDCGEIWGRLVLVGADGKRKHFHEIASISCVKHFDQWAIAGSLLGSYRGEEWLKYLPTAAVQREFMIHLKYYLGDMT